ncbi:hypothetical protein [Lichenicola sp.]|uniref:hypothetical protein n=1 Tax=Lichenicola sp. TaxID=2804529 RepID=UPI003B002683
MHGTEVLDQVAHRIGVMGLVGQHDGARCKIVEQDFGGTTIGNGAADQHETELATFAVGERVEFAIAVTLADPDRLEERPPFPPPANRWAFMCVLPIGTLAGGSPAAAGAMNISCKMLLAAHCTN